MRRSGEGPKALPEEGSYSPTHWPVSRPVTWFIKPPESPDCGGGSFPKQLRLPWIVLV